jgi:hypothetical protein
MQSKSRYLYKIRYRVILLSKSISFSKTNKLSRPVTELLETKLELFCPSSSFFLGVEKQNQKILVYVS